MSNISGNLFYASDKAVFDALIQRKIRNEDLAELFFERGTIISKNTSREVLSKQFSRNIHDYYDHQFISKIFSANSKKEKTTSDNIKNDLENDDLESILEELSESQSNSDTIVQHTVTDDGFIVDLQYKEIDYNKTEFKQVVQKKAQIILKKENNEWIIKSPLNNFIEDIKEKLLDNISTSLDSTDELIVERIELTSILSPTLRTEFFTKLINSISGYTLFDVTDVYVYNGEEDDSDSEDLGIHISKASLKGNGVIGSPELSSLYDKDFYIWKINFKIRISQFSDIYEIEAQFADPKNFDKFSYIIKGLYKYNEDSYNKQRKHLSSNDELTFSDLIDKNAKQIMIEIKETSNS